MKIETVKACDVTVGDIIEKCGKAWTVLRAVTTTIAKFEAREFLCEPLSTVPGVESAYFEAFADDEMTVYKETEISK
jgi:hypothetical protein